MGGVINKLFGSKNHEELDAKVTCSGNVRVLQIDENGDRQSLLQRPKESFNESGSPTLNYLDQNLYSKCAIDVSSRFSHESTLYQSYYAVLVGDKLKLFLRKPEFNPY
mmetsp:Transcript_2021/g.1469  ORF Transcript_2021/g.1469 Transcript_2021/m.1469 type:complete len:108 (-) Transcript_2021:675-998(-)